MPRILATSLALAALALAGPAQGQGPFFLVYAVPAGSTPTCETDDPATFQAGNNPPMLPSAEIPLNVSTPLDLCMLYWPLSDSDETETVCMDGGGTEVCAVRLGYAVNGGSIKIASFTPAPGFKGVRKRSDGMGGEIEVLAGDPNATRLTVVGGDPMSGQQGQDLSGTFGGIRLGTATLNGGTALNALFELQQGGFANASNQRRSVLNQLNANTMSTCGSPPTVDPGEECDDGNSVAGDGCFPNCQNEDGFALSGTTGSTGGTIDLEVDSVPVTASFGANEQAEDVIEAVVYQTNSEPNLGAQAVQVDDPDQPGGNDGRRMATDGTVTNVTVTNGGTLTLSVPEPGGLLMLVSGIAFLLTFGRGRIRR